MIQPVSSPAQLNTRPSQLETDQDLIHDQLNYFRSSNALPHLSDSVSDHQQDDHHISILSRERDAQTSTSTSLEPIKERTVSRRSRRRPRSNNPSTVANGFPLPTTIADHTTNRFARKPQPFLTNQKNPNSAQPQHPFPNPASAPSISKEVGARIASMSVEQIRAAQQEIYDTLKPESIQILKKRWLQSREDLPEPHRSGKPPEQLTPAEFTPSEDRPQTGDEELLSTCVLTDKQQFAVPDPLSTDAHTELLVPIKSDESDEEERDKRIWMTDAQEPAPSQKAVEELIAKALENLGDIGKMRFDLDGAVLTAEEVQTLPSHLGLHHHGSSPASAGYTLPDILVLARSTVVSQRIMGLRMLKSVVHRHRDEVITPLIESGSLTSTFSDLPADEAFYAAITSQTAYLETVEVFVQDVSLLDRCDLVNGLYFESNFYSPCPVTSYSPVLQALADSDVILTLIRITRATALQPRHVSIATRSLRLIRLLLTRVPHAANGLLQNKELVVTLKNLATGSTESHPILLMLSCDVLAHAFVSLGWKGGEVLEWLQTDVMDDRFLRNVSSKMIWLLDSNIEEITALRSATAKGAIRLIRAALTFQRGVEPFAALVHAVCRLVRNEASATETYLSLEAYSHALFLQANSRASDEHEKASSREKRNEEHQHQNEDDLIKRRLSELLPLAISATSFFVDTTSPAEESRAAAGHFAATLFALTSNPVVEEYVLRILNVCSSSTRELTHVATDSPELIQKIRLLASLSHAGARLLSKVKLEEAFVEREVKMLIAASYGERKLMEMEMPSTVSTARVVANASAEWIGVYSRVSSSKKTVDEALKLLPCLTDVRVIVDLLSRTILNVDILRGLDPTISVPTAQKCANILLPLAMTELSSIQEVQREVASTCDSKASDSKHFRCLSFEDLCNLWVTKVDACEALLCVTKALFQSRLLRGTALFECFLRTPVTRYSDSVFHFMFTVAQSCVDEGAPLIGSSSKTVMSSWSTTVNSPIAESVISLCDFLLSRGPSTTTSAHNENTDFLASILVTLMCGFDIDSTLRVSMWKRTVDDCGGAVLYQDAISLENNRCSAGVMSGRELDDMLRLFGVSISEGYLDGERCPTVLRNTILARITTALSAGRTPNDLLEKLASSVRSRTSLFQRLSKMLTLPMESTQKENLLSEFLDEVSFRS